MVERNLGAQGILPDLLELGEERRRDLLTRQLHVLAAIIQSIHYSSSLALGQLKRNPGIELCDATEVLTASSPPCHFLRHSGISNLSAQQLFKPIESSPRLCHNDKFRDLSKFSDKTWVFWADLAATPMVRAFSPKAT